MLESIEGVDVEDVTQKKTRLLRSQPLVSLEHPRRGNKSALKNWMRHLDVLRRESLWQEAGCEAEETEEQWGRINSSSHILFFSSQLALVAGRLESLVRRRSANRDSYTICVRRKL